MSSCFNFIFLAIIACSGKDIVLRSGLKVNKRIMLILPLQFDFLPTTEGTLCHLEEMKSNCPRLVFQLSEGKTAVCEGKWVRIKSKLLAVHCKLSKKQQCLLSDLYDRALVFEKPITAETTKALTEDTISKQYGCSRIADPVVIQRTASSSSAANRASQESDEETASLFDSGDDDSEELMSSEASEEEIISKPTPMLKRKKEAVVIDDETPASKSKRPTRKARISYDYDIEANETSTAESSDASEEWDG